MEEDKESVDMKENQLLKLDKEILIHLLKDRTTGRNIMWCTDNYKEHGSEYGHDQPITIDLITSGNGNIIKPRVEKSRQDQQKRIRDKAEVFTPSWVCNKQNNLVDNAWFGRENIFNNETENGWVSIKDKIEFSAEPEKKWSDYVELNRMEITCGEAPYITSRYDTVSGNYIEVPDRIGLLDRKLRVVNENTETREDWLEWTEKSVQSIYGFEWQGDNLLIARENVLLTIIEHFHYKFQENLSSDELKEFAKIISWNLWQMDGLKFVIPNSCAATKKNDGQLSLFENFGEKQVYECEGCKKGNHQKHTGIYCKIKDWEKNKVIRFVDLLKKEGQNG